jgi:hypothetical protein
MRDAAAGQQQARGEKLREAREEAGKGVTERMGVRAGESAAVGPRSGNPVWKALLQEDAAGAVREREGREVQEVTESGEKLAGSSSASVGGEARGGRRKVERRKHQEEEEKEEEVRPCLHRGQRAGWGCSQEIQPKSVSAIDYLSEQRLVLPGEDRRED